MPKRVAAAAHEAPPPSLRPAAHRGGVDPPVALVTGGAQGIGRRICERFLAAGYRVVAADADGDACAAATREIGSQGFRAERCDVADERQVARAVAAAVRWGGGLDALIANAGIGGEWQPLERTPLAEWQRVIGVNLGGPFLCAKHAAPHLRARRGAIVTLASTRALQSEPNSFAYSASKGGVVALTHALAISLGPEIRANCISPGWIVVDELKKPSRRKRPELRPIDHQQHPTGRVGSADDIAELALFLCSSSSGFTTGANVVCDGGMSRKMIYAE
jgi:NAD(P)-dependent dehydrogenase (short-subunit alcohol dehydrogenase family)